MGKHSAFLYLIILSALFIGCKQKIRLEDTVVSIKEIKDIGELVTAEYYGEVLSSLSILEESKMDSAFQQAFKELADLKHSIDDSVETRLEIRIDRLDERIKEKPENKRLIRRKNRLERRNKRKKRRLLTRIMNGRQEATFEMLQDASRQNGRQLIDQIEEVESYDAFKLKNDLSIQEYKAKERNKEDIAYLGRGTVKAGYDLKSLDSLNVFTSPGGDTIYFLDFDPVLFDVDINPWFYLDDSTTSLARKDSTHLKKLNQLYGFELVYENTKRNTKITLNDVNRVKSECKRKLRQEALDRDIYAIAKRNAEEALLSFFSLFNLQPGKEVKAVVISHSKYFEDIEEYLYDQTITELELDEIKELIATDLDTLDRDAFPYQNLGYQHHFLDKFVMALYEGSLGGNNAEGWKKTYADYFEQRNIYLNE